MIQNLLLNMLSGVAAGLISSTLSSAVIFDGLREFLDKKNKFLSELISCPYCLSFYFAGMLDVVVKSQIEPYNGFMGVYMYGVSYFFMVFVSVITAGLIVFLYSE